MPGLFGDFHTMPLKDLVIYLGNRRASGTLTLERGAIRKEAAIKQGMAISAGSNVPREYLGQFLINLGYISEEQFTKAYQTQQETQILLGRILVMIGAVSEEMVRTALSMKIRETLLEAFLWEEGTFNFDASGEPTAPDGVELRVELLDLHREGEFRETAWQAIRGAFPHGKVRLELNEGNLAEPPKPGSLDQRLVAAIRAGQTIDEMVLSLHATDFFLYQRLYALYRLEAVRVAQGVESELQEGGEPTLGGEIGPEQILQQAQALLASEAYTEAEALARRAHELQASPQSEEVLRRAEAGLTEKLRAELMVRGLVPRLMVSAGAMRQLQLTPPEKYLLSRVDGVREVASIVQVSPLRELEALKYFQQFVERRLVQLESRAG